MKWIEVSERLPKKAGIYITKCKFRDIPETREFTGSAFTNYQGYKVFKWLDESTPSITIQQGLDIWEAACKWHWQDSYPSKESYFKSIGIDINKLK